MESGAWGIQPYTLAPENSQLKILKTIVDISPYILIATMTLMNTLAISWTLTTCGFSVRHYIHSTVNTRTILWGMCHHSHGGGRLRLEEGGRLVTCQCFCSHKWYSWVPTQVLQIVVKPSAPQAASTGLHLSALLGHTASQMAEISTGPQLIPATT